MSLEVSKNISWLSSNKNPQKTSVLTSKAVFSAPKPGFRQLATVWRWAPEVRPFLKFATFVQIPGSASRSGLQIVYFCSISQLFLRFWRPMMFFSTRKALVCPKVLFWTFWSPYFRQFLTPFSRRSWLLIPPNACILFISAPNVGNLPSGIAADSKYEIGNWSMRHVSPSVWKR